jgi:hypothetical protein
MASATRPELSSRLIHRNANVDETDNFRLTDYTGIIMVTFGQSGSPINIVALGVAASATLVVLYVMCAVVAMVAPGLSLAHGWLTLFSTAPAGSLRGFVEGVVWSVVLAWVIAIVLGYTYNRLA